ncbi:hypothetical protein TOL_1547 [Thalassolituus oleivorans MIL-1]|uniref:DUF6436 domain-containing protein n=2 Tax=Thalassolituus oleivorans TaxID=187493 RepID=M5DS42_9GAMM|nr:hypothetical protein CN03_10445 [Thalassolituus oleivorans]CCU71972.1 hypothetical protein TOL_1547 [Thalassolituus oleivorans MIL-1]
MALTYTKILEGDILTVCYNSAMTTSTSTVKHILLIALITLWLGGSLFGLWWFQQKQLRPFVADTDPVEAMQIGAVDTALSAILQRLPASEIEQQIILLHLWNPDCLCNAVSQRHLDSLLSHFTKQELRAIALAPASITTEQIDDFQRLNGQRMELLVLKPEDELPLSASPGLALYKVENSNAYQLSYYGAYGFGALCTLSEDSLFTNMVNDMKHGSYGPFMNVAGSGCFCPWPKAFTQLP